MTSLKSNSETPLVTLADAGVRRNGRWLVRGVDFSVSRGEIVTLIGPNGSGKSTSAKMAIGVLSPDEGRVERKPGLRVAYVPQKLSVDWTMPLTVKRLMTLTVRLNDEEIVAALDAVGISHLAGAEVQHLSGGEFQRALLARAIARKPDLLVLDEPVQGVDFAGEIALYDLITSIRNSTGCGILLISHDLHVVMAETDTVICLNGHVCCRGTPDAVSQSPEYMRLFGAAAGRTLAVYSHHHDHTHLPDGRVRHEDGTITEHCHVGDGHHHEDDHAGHAHSDHGHGAEGHSLDLAGDPAGRHSHEPDGAHAHATDADGNHAHEHGTLDHAHQHSVGGQVQTDGLPKSATPAKEASDV
ncbi:ATP-binding cassette domain-containing protein [Ciceribacter naphthalenivorans]|nr:metal ABC transporter ATP-binding protein [Ciceribacter naphthalenivorans]